MFDLQDVFYHILNQSSKHFKALWEKQVQRAANYHLFLRPVWGDESKYSETVIVITSYFSLMYYL